MGFISHPLVVPGLDCLPVEVYLRSQHMPAASGFLRHKHDWHQLVYAISGTLTVMINKRWYLVSPDQAFWVTANTYHSVASQYGAQFTSLYVTPSASHRLPKEAVILGVSPLFRELIRELAVVHETQSDQLYLDHLRQLVLDLLTRFDVCDVSLPWPNQPLLHKLCKSLYENPSKDRGMQWWAGEFGVSNRTLSRRFQADIGVSYRQWLLKLRLYKAIEMLIQGHSVTAIALELGYGSTSSFCFMFKQQMGCTPNQYVK